MGLIDTVLDLSHSMKSKSQTANNPEKKLTPNRRDHIKKFALGTGLLVTFGSLIAMNHTEAQTGSFLAEENNPSKGHIETSASAPENPQNNRDSQIANNKRARARPFTIESQAGNPNAPRIEISPTKTVGGIDSMEVDTLLTTHHKGLLTCYTDTLTRTPSLETRMQINATVTARGPLGELGATMSTPDSEMRRCVLDKLSELEFPTPNTGFGSVTVELAFRLGA